MIRIDLSDFGDLADEIKRGIEKGVERTRHDPGLGQAMRSGVQNHFDRLAGGGSMQTVEGSVNWPTARAPVTLAERMVGYSMGDTPILQASGQMREGYGRNARFTSERRGRGSIRAVLGTADEFAEMKAQRHHKGGVYLTTFPHLTAGRTGRPLRTRIDFPQREFLFWDPEMADSVVQTTRRNIDRGLREELGSRGLA
jgi:hypothetical protein